MRNDPGARGAANEGQCPIVVFLGAGASALAGVPLTRGFVSTLRQHLQDRGLRDALPHYDRLVRFLTEFNHGRAEPGVSGDDEPDIEAVYEALVRLAAPEEDAFLRSREDLPVPAEAAQQLRLATERHIREKAFLAPDQVGYLDELVALRNRGQVVVFSTNYDTGMEAFCERHHRRWEDGFRLRWDPTVFEDADVDFCLHKLHGSVLWYRDELGGYFRSPLRPTETDGVPLRWFGGACEPLLVYPARKSAQDAPYAHGLAQLSATLGAPETQVTLLVLGYSFRDEHLRQVLFDAARSNDRLTVVLVDPNASHVFRAALARYGEAPSPLATRVLCVNDALDDGGEVLRDVLQRRVPSFLAAHRNESDFYRERRNGANEMRNAANSYAYIGDLRGYERCMSVARSLSPSADLESNVVHALTQLRLQLQDLATCLAVQRGAAAVGVELLAWLGQPGRVHAINGPENWWVAFGVQGAPVSLARALREACDTARIGVVRPHGPVGASLLALRAWAEEIASLVESLQPESHTFVLPVLPLVDAGVLPAKWRDRSGNTDPDELRGEVVTRMDYHLRVARPLALLRALGLDDSAPSAGPR